MIEFISSDQFSSPRRSVFSRREGGGSETRPATLFNLRNLFQRHPRRAKIAGSVFIILLLLGFFVVYPSFSLYSQAKATYSATLELQSAIATRDLEVISNSLDGVGAAVSRMEKVYRRFGYLRFFPLLNRYYDDGRHLIAAANFALEGGDILVDSLKPFAELLGLRRGFGSLLTTEQQIVNLAEIFPQISPQADDALGKLFLVKKELDQVDAERYPEEIRGVRIKFWLEEVRELLAGVEPLLKETKSITEVLPRLLGIPERTYLVLFQNDAELRATGGFITALGFVSVKDGQVTNTEVHDVGFATNRIAAERISHPVARYLRTSGILFHDANYFPDFRVSAERILDFWRTGKGLPEVDFVVAITTGAGARLLEFTGPITIPGYDLDFAGYSWLPKSCLGGGKAFTSENLVCRLEFWVERVGGNTRSGRSLLKGELLGKLAEALIAKLASAPAEVWAQIAELGFEMLKEKDLLLYSTDLAEQRLFEMLDFAGRTKDYAGDYLHISDSNLGGKKTDMFMQEEVEQSLVQLENGRWRKTVKIKYYNPQPYDNWVSANYKDWVRIYVPEGSELVEVTGAKESTGSWGELGKTVFDAFFHLWPQKEGTITFVYDLPSSVAKAMEETKSYRLLIQKQPGTNITLVKVEIGDKMEVFDLNEDREIEIAL